MLASTRGPRADASIRPYRAAGYKTYFDVTSHWTV